MIARPFRPSRSSLQPGWIVLICVIGLSSAPQTGSAAQTLLEDRKLVPNNASPMDQFGHNVALDGSTALIGALFDDGRGSASGTAFLYNAATGMLQDQLFGNDTSSEDTFGDGVALANGFAFVGAPQESSDGTFAGAAYAFSTATGNQLRRLRPFQTIFVGENPSGSAFGWSIDASQRWLVIGAPGDIEGANGGGGAFYTYDLTSNALVGKFFASDPAFADNLGRTVAVDDNFVIAAAPFDDDNGQDSGSVYVFDAATGTQLHKLTPNDGAPGDLFGLALDIHRGTIIVGAPFANARGSNSGAAYLFDANTGAQLAKLLPEQTQAADQFGSAVAIDAGFTAIGARAAQVNQVATGVAYLFDTLTTTLRATLVASDGAFGDTLGNAIAIDNRTVLAGAEGDDDAGDFAGAAYVFTIPVSIPDCPVDLNADDLIDFDDVALLFADLGAPPSGAPRPSDINLDDATDLRDVAILQTLFAAECP